MEPPSPQVNVEGLAQNTQSPLIPFRGYIFPERGERSVIPDYTVSTSKWWDSSTRLTISGHLESLR